MIKKYQLGNIINIDTNNQIPLSQQVQITPQMMQQRIFPYAGLNTQQQMDLATQRALANLNSTPKAGNKILAQGVGMATDYLSNMFTGDMFGDSYLGSTIGQAFSNTLSSAGNTISNNLLKGTTLTQGLGQNIGSSLSGVVAGVAGDQIGKGVTSLMGNSKLGKGIGAGLANGIGSFGGTVLSNLANGNSALNGFTAASKAANGIGTIGKFGAMANIGGLAGSAVGAALSAVTGPSKEYGGKYGNVTQVADTAYDLVQAGASAFGPVGAIVSGGMALNKGLSNIFGSTDGMCVCAGTKVYTADGRYINIEDLKQEDGILGWDQITHKITPQTIDCIIEPRQKECIRIELDNGRTLECSVDHPILSNIREKAESHKINGKTIAYREWSFREARELNVGNWVGLADKVDYWGVKEMPNAYLVGMLIGDGTYTYESSCKLWTADSSTWKYLEENNLAVLIKQCTPENSNGKYSIENRDYRIINGMQLVKDLGIAYQKGTEKTLPKNIDQYNKDSICKLIAGLFDTDGSFSANEEKKTFSITLYQSNLSLLKHVQHLLYKLGIISHLSTRKASINKMKNGRTINSNISYRLEITDRRSILTFSDLIPINIDYKKENLEKICKIVFPKKDKDHYELSGARQAKIIAITPIGIQTVYNLTVSKDHTYLANDIITHNTLQDSILGSAWAGAPLKWINMWGSSKTGTFDKQSWQNSEKTSNFMGSSFGNIADKFKKAREEAGKVYGTFSQGAKREAQRNIDYANMAWNKILAMANQNEYQNVRSRDMTSINNQRYAQNIQGGFTPLQIGKMGMKILNNTIDHNRGMRYLSAAALIDNKQLILSNWE